MLVTADGGYMLGGSSESGISGDVTKADRGGYDYWIVKIDAGGKQVWDKRFGGDDDDSLGDMLATADGYLLGGTSLSGKSGDKTEPDALAFWIIKIKDLSVPPMPPAPLFTSVSPRAALPGTIVNISGANLLTTSAVRFNGVAANFTAVNDSTLIAIIPVTANSGKIEVETAGGKVSSEDAFIVLQPVIIVFAPERGYAGSRVLLFGKNLATAKEISFNGVPAQDFTIYNDFFILARVPEGATSGKISIDLEGGAHGVSSWTYRVLHRFYQEAITRVEATNPDDKQVMAYPNPFTEDVKISVSHEQTESINLIIYSASGQQIREIPFGELGAGRHDLQWDGTDNDGTQVAEGLYFYRVVLDGKPVSGKLLKAGSGTE